MAAERGAVERGRDALHEAVDGADLVARRRHRSASSRATVRAVLDARARRQHRHRRRLDEGRRVAPPPAPTRGSSADIRSAAPRHAAPGRAAADLFEGATWFLTPTAATAPERLRHRARLRLGRSARGRSRSSPDAHDRLVAVTSHLPHVARERCSSTRPAATRIDGHDPLQAAGGSLRDMTRIGGANPRIWVDIFLDNREALAAALAEQRRRARAASSARSRRGTPGFLARWIGEASGHRRRMLATAFADPGALQRLRIHIPDRPGVLAGIFQALGAERINVEDFELDHVSAERGGTLTMLVSGEGEAERATDLLEQSGLRRGRLAGDRRMNATEDTVLVEPVPRLVGHLAFRATSRSRTAPC